MKISFNEALNNGHLKVETKFCFVGYENDIYVVKALDIPAGRMSLYTESANHLYNDLHIGLYKVCEIYIHSVKFSSKLIALCNNKPIPGEEEFIKDFLRQAM